MSDQQDAAHVAIGELIQRIDPGVMMTRFVLVAEVIDNDGGRSVWSVEAPGSTSWDVLGLLEYAKAAESVSVWTAGDDDDD